MWGWYNRRQAAQRQSDLLVILSAILASEKRIMATLADLKTEIASVKTVEDSALALINGLVAKLAELASQTPITPEDVQALIDELAANAKPLADSVVANTPAA